MGVAYTGDRGEPVVASSGNTPTFAGDMTSISEFFAARSLRRFSTVAALLASAGSELGDWAVAENAPGAYFAHTGAGWFMHGVPRFADVAARNAALAAPVAGWRSRVVTEDFDREWSGSAWTSPLVDLLSPTVFERSSANFASSSNFQACALGTNIAGAAFSHAAGVFTCVEAGTYLTELTLSYAGNASGNRGLRLVTSDGPVRTALFPSQSASLDQTVSARILAAFDVDDTLTTFAFQNSGASLATVGHVEFSRVA